MHPIMILCDGSECKKIRQFEFLWVLFGYLLIHPINQVVMDLRKLLNLAFYKSNYLWDLTVMCVRGREKQKKSEIFDSAKELYVCCVTAQWRQWTFLPAATINQNRPLEEAATSALYSSPGSVCISPHRTR